VTKPAAHPTRSALRVARILVAALSACVLGIGCDRQSQAAPTITTVRQATDAGVAGDDAAESAATKIAFAWLASLGRHDTAGLFASTRVPFVFRDTGREGHCKNVVAGTAEELPGTLKCLLDDRVLAAVLKANSDAQGGPLPRELLPKWAAKWAKDVGGETYPIAIVYTGDHASFDFIVFASPSGIHGLFKNASVERH
jgi:hypothetical protein